MRLPPMSGREAIKRLQRAGFLATRQRGTLARFSRRDFIPPERF
jgi:predicted RNA binding protein YcfA (HicA-like mRNA interferase family)